jgi:glycosyltransferase involved in cell wall biosynthesis
MQFVKPDLVSVVIPCFNRADYLQQTLTSICGQSYADMEIVVVDDGSTDRTASLVAQFDDSRIIYIKQENRGVSAARNTGLFNTKGEFIVFFDSDDVMTPDFIERRVDLLKANPDIGFSAAMICTFTDDVNNHSIPLLPCYEDLINEVVLFKEGRLSIPSNYLYRRRILRREGVYFNEKLSSTADRFFLFRISNVAKCGLVPKGGELYYRVSPQSMSNKLTVSLVYDQVGFFREVLKSPFFPAVLRREVKWKRNQVVIGSFFQLKRYNPFIRWLIISFIQYPAKTVSFVVGKIGNQLAVNQHTL